MRKYDKVTVGGAYDPVRGDVGHICIGGQDVAAGLPLHAAIGFNALGSDRTLLIIPGKHRAAIAIV